MNTEITTSRTPYDLYNPENKNRAVFETRPASPSYYSIGKGMYLVQNKKSDWVEVNRSTLRSILVQDGARAKKNDDELISPLDAAIQHIDVELRVDLYGLYAGRKKGLMLSGGDRILVTKELPLLEPKEGSWDVLWDCITGLFGSQVDEPTETDKEINGHQAVLFFLWLRRHLHALYKYSPQQGPALVLCGPAGAGKTLLVEIMKECLGKRIASAFNFMSGQDKFNNEMFSSALWTVDDEKSDSDFKGRAEFKTQIKKITSHSSLRCRGMHSSAMEIETHKALVICTNESSEALRILPEPEPMDQQEVWDKIILLKCFSRKAWPMPASTDEEKTIFWEKIKEELPAMVFDLLYAERWEESSKSPEFQGGRWPLKSWQHPEIMELLHQTTPDDEFLTFILRIYDSQRESSSSFVISHEDFFEKAFSSSSRLLPFQQDKIQRWASTGKSFWIRMGKIRSRYPKAFSEKYRLGGKGNTCCDFYPNEL